MYTGSFIFAREFVSFVCFSILSSFSFSSSLWYSTDARESVSFASGSVTIIWERWLYTYHHIWILLPKGTMTDSSLVERWSLSVISRSITVDNWSDSVCCRLSLSCHRSLGERMMMSYPFLDNSQMILQLCSLSVSLSVSLSLSPSLEGYIRKRGKMRKGAFWISSINVVTQISRAGLVIARFSGW